MGLHLRRVVLHSKEIIRECSLRLTRHPALLPSTTVKDVPRGHFAVYIGESQKKRFVVPISYLEHPLFQDLLIRAEEEFGFDHRMGGLIIPCNEDAFLDLTSHLSAP
ncbi:PREDICTED: auxin-responsive protein SAUR21-like [Nelumbo nucifera]|uniref:Auxin-responsive protein SAUR21-like n=2 Tax=Nelumbo nucifera TaxID=4432 RepID=A0A822Z251_NELNU|nr:PREDICTED: auxin-responsive protein SAUR21-like [Nelumbo nucifera]DAD40504.1 TPA_asm: hypothetical protein HUJ06_014827 [Nelumbo nucifera]